MKAKLSILFCTFILLNMVGQGQDGADLFKKNCATCHTVGKGKLVGPDLKGVHDRYKEDWLLKWIKSSQTLVKKGDPLAVKLFEENNRSIMPDPSVSEAEIKTIIDFVKAESARPVEVAAEKPKGLVTVETKAEAYDYHQKDKAPMTWKAASFILGGLCILLLIVAIALANSLATIARDSGWNQKQGSS